MRTVILAAVLLVMAACSTTFSAGGVEACVNTVVNLDGSVTCSITFRPENNK